MRSFPVRNRSGRHERDRAGYGDEANGDTTADSGFLERDPALHSRILLSLDIDRIR
jgi:hypothetical protein